MWSNNLPSARSHGFRASGRVGFSRSLEAGLGLLFKALLNYVVPFLVSNHGLLAATRRRRGALHQ